MATLSSNVVCAFAVVWAYWVPALKLGGLDSSAAVVMISCTHQPVVSGLQADGSQFSKLALDLVSQILQHVPQGHRLTSCAIVCQAFAAAATAATTSIKKEGFAGKMLCHTQKYLQHHGKQLKLLKLNPFQSGISQLQRPSELQLPCAELQQLSCLQLSNLQLQLPDAQDPSTTSSTLLSNPSNSSQTPAHLMPKLQELKLECCWMSPSTALQLSQLTALTRLKLWDISQEGNMCHLSHDTVKRILQPMAKLQRLKLLHVGDTKTADIVTSIPSSVTALSLCADYWLEPALPCSPQLTQLQKLKLADASGFSPVVLASMPQLLLLQLQNCTLVPSRSAAAGGLSGAAEFLAAVRELHQLQHLSVHNSDDNEVPFEDVQAIDCSALTTSNHLTHLEVFSAGQPLPETAIQHMFPAGRVLPQLQHLVLQAL